VTETQVYPKHVYARAPIGQTVTVYNIQQEHAVLNGTAKFTVVLGAGGFDGQSGNTYTVIAPGEEK
jgi:hypothetical protein